MLGVSDLLSVWNYLLKLENIHEKTTDYQTAEVAIQWGHVTILNFALYDNLCETKIKAYAIKYDI